MDASPHHADRARAAVANPRFRGAFESGVQRSHPRSCWVKARRRPQEGSLVDHLKRNTPPKLRRQTRATSRPKVPVGAGVAELRTNDTSTAPGVSPRPSRIYPTQTTWELSLPREAWGSRVKAKNQCHKSVGWPTPTTGVSLGRAGRDLV